VGREQEVVRGRHAWDLSPRQLVERAVGNAVLASLVAEVAAVLTGRMRWPSLLIAIVSVSYLVEAADRWRAARAHAEEVELNAILDSEDAQVLQVA
jgi:hypothetical protein